jgi:hypothetical protein
MFSKSLLRSIRDDLPMDVTIGKLGKHAPPAKQIEGYFRFLCPQCGELQATLNPRNNLAHCFCCKTNFNNIDLLIAIGYDFKAAASILRNWLIEHEQRGSQHTRPSPNHETPID